MNASVLGRPGWIAALACLAGATLRFVLARDAALWGDEFHSLQLLRRGLLEILGTYDRFGSGIALPLLQRAAAEVLGETVLAARLPALVAGLAGLALIQPVGRRLVGAGPAALAAIGLALSPIHLFYSHFARSYTLAVLLALMLADGIARLLERPGSRTPLVEIGVASALLPWSHLTAGALLAAGALGASVAAPRGARRPLLVAVGAGALIGALLYLPARESLRAFVAAKAGGGARVPFGVLDVMAVIAGSREAAAIWLVALPLAAVAWLRARGRGAAPLLAFVLLPPAAIAVMNPTSNAVAFSRYLLASLPFALLLLGWGALRAGERALGARYGPALAAVALIALFASGAFRPLGAAIAQRDGVFANTYLGLHPIETFDVAPPSARDFYRSLATRGDVTGVVEMPAVRLAGALLFRSYAREHGRPVRLGLVAEPAWSGAAYAEAERPLAACDGVQVIIAHTDLETEVREYLGFVESVLPARDTPIAGPLVALPAIEPRLSQKQLETLRRHLGPPAFESERLLAWEVSCGRGQGARR